MKIKYLSLAVGILLLSCHSKQNTEEEIIAALEMSPGVACNAPPPSCAPKLNEMVKFAPPVIKDDALEENESGLEVPESSQKSTAKKIIKDGSMSIKVEDLERAKKHINSVLKKFNAYYEQEDYTNYEKVTRYGLKIRVPSKEFEKFLAAAEKGEGEITSKNINVRDVTDEYTDTEIRLSTKQLFRKRYYELLNNAKKVDDMLSIEENIRTLQEDIESFEGRLKLMNDQITYSTLDLNLFTEKDPEVIKEETFGQKVKGNLRTGWTSVVSFVLWLIQQWPWFVVAAAFIFIVRRWWKRRKKRLANA